MPRLSGDTELNRFRCRFIPSVNVEFGKNGSDVVAHGTRREKERICDLLRALALDEQSEHLQLAAGELKGICLRHWPRTPR